MAIKSAVNENLGIDNMESMALGIGSKTVKETCEKRAPQVKPLFVLTADPFQSMFSHAY